LVNWLSRLLTPSKLAIGDREASALAGVELRCGIVSVVE
jgi:hypothetical protein